MLQAKKRPLEQVFDNTVNIAVSFDELVDNQDKIMLGLRRSRSNPNLADQIPQLLAQQKQLLKLLDDFELASSQEQISTGDEVDKENTPPPAVSKKRVSDDESIKPSKKSLKTTTKKPIDWLSDSDASDLESDIDQELSLTKEENYVILYRGISFAQTRYSKDEKTRLKNKRQIGKPIPCGAAIEHCTREQTLDESTILRVGKTIRDRVGNLPVKDRYMQMYTNQYTKFRELLQFQYDKTQVKETLTPKDKRLAETLFTPAISPKIEVISTTLSALEACRYAIGDRFASSKLKSLHQAPAYQSSGRPNHRFMGRVSLFILSEKDYIDSQAYYIRKAYAQNLVKSKFTYAHSQEVVFSGFIEKSFMSYDLPIIMPDFRKDYKKQYITKYGLSKPDYEAYQQKFEKASSFEIKILENNIVKHMLNHTAKKLEEKSKFLLTLHKAYQAYPSLQENQFQDKPISFRDARVSINAQQEGDKPRPKQDKKRVVAKNYTVELQKIEKIILQKKYQQALDLLEPLEEEIPAGAQHQKFLLAILQCHCGMGEIKLARKVFNQLDKKGDNYALAKTMMEEIPLGAYIKNNKQTPQDPAKKLLDCALEIQTLVRQKDSNANELRTPLTKFLTMLSSVSSSPSFAKDNMEFFNHDLPEILTSSAIKLQTYITNELSAMLDLMPLVIKLMVTFDQLMANGRKTPWTAKFPFGSSSQSAQNVAVYVERDKIVDNIAKTYSRVFSAHSLAKNKLHFKSLCELSLILDESKLIKETHCCYEQLKDCAPQRLEMQ